MHPHYYITTPIISALSCRGTRNHRITDIIADAQVAFFCGICSKSSSRLYSDCLHNVLGPLALVS
jgi:hypothetical protein